MPQTTKYWKSSGRRISKTKGSLVVWHPYKGRIFLISNRCIHCVNTGGEIINGGQHALFGQGNLGIDLLVKFLLDALDLLPVHKSGIDNGLLDKLQGIACAMCKCNLLFVSVSGPWNRSWNCCGTRTRHHLDARGPVPAPAILLD